MSPQLGEFFRCSHHRMNNLTLQCAVMEVPCAAAQAERLGEGGREKIASIQRLLAVPRAVSRVLTLTQYSCSAQDFPTVALWVFLASLCVGPAYKPVGMKALSKGAVPVLVDNILDSLSPLAYAHGALRTWVTYSAYCWDLSSSILLSEEHQRIQTSEEQLQSHDSTEE